MTVLVKATDKQKRYIKRLLSIHAKITRQRLAGAMADFNIQSLENLSTIRAGAYIDRLHRAGLHRELDKLRRVR